MTRLSHSDSGFRRYMQMSNKDFFIFIEGKHYDEYYYNKIIEQKIQNGEFSYELVNSDRLSTPGKNGVLAYYEYLKSKGFLVSFRGSKKTVSFFLDKDIDDIHKKIKRSKFIVYTKFYSVENHIFTETNLMETILCSASLSSSSLNHNFDSDNYLEKYKNNYLEWILISIYCQKNRVRNMGRFNFSKINRDTFGEVDLNLKNQYLEQIRINEGIDLADFNDKFRIFRKNIIRKFRANPDGYFKGKWYPSFILHELKSLLGNSFMEDGFLASITRVSSSFINYSECDYFLDKIDQILLRLK
jgi:hypothetical protein